MSERKGQWIFTLLGGFFWGLKRLSLSALLRTGIVLGHYVFIEERIVSLGVNEVERITVMKPTFLYMKKAEGEGKVVRTIGRERNGKEDGESERWGDIWLFLFPASSLFYLT